MQHSQGTSGDGYWARLDLFLRTDPNDPGCTRCREEMDVCAELCVRGGSPAASLPGVAAHLESCGDCREELAGLVASLREELHLD